MKTAFLLMAQYDGMAVIPAELVCRDYFRHLDPLKFVAKASKGEIRLPVVRMEGSNKAARGVHLNDLAAYIDNAADTARKELAQITKGVPLRGGQDAGILMGPFVMDEDGTIRQK